ncbi:polysaccharide biosynthesis/export family protein [Sphingomonas mesophila]|uniref:polysaccharide biosynthesis/export family protein n=1 Tax=Sphingomonas mesophila TaxID=2303576 RepID=UPI000E56A0D0|nr:polysaccharide biosynthesis/export family protein [Sphingomonas mesophila]
MKISSRRRRMSWRALVAVSLLSLAAACSDTRGGPIPYNVSDFGSPDRPSAITLAEDYRIAPLDTLTVKVFKMADLSGDYEVDLLGQIALPLVGNVKAADLTTAQLDALLTERFGSRYLENPDVLVGVKSSTRANVTVDGSVGKTGAIPVSGSMTLMQAVAQAGGVTENGNARRVAIFRQINGQRQAAAFDLVEIRRGRAPDPRVYPGDIVVVDGSATKALHRQILNSLPLLSIFRPF